MVNKHNARLLSKIVLGLGFLSIIGSLASWVSSRSAASSNNPNMDASTGERMANFLGLWPPTLFILSNVIDHWSDRM